MPRQRKPKAQPRPKDPPEDEPGPQLLTQRRAANQVEQLYLEVAHVVGRLEGLTHYLDSQTVRDCANALTAELRALMGIRARLLTGEIPVVRGEDRETWAHRQPLLASIEANGDGATNGPPANRLALPATQNAPQVIRRAGRKCKGCGEVRPAKERSCPRCNSLASSPATMPSEEEAHDAARME